ncbi:MAG TPA: UDP-N-acetylmuramoyl-L-alanine--D-glutamate ligase [Candidatus Limnocylindrales bacterium]|nr:UDP-N-acetylmuramoyl-L-alanine--D-glutamate ligase [Candidatus Limnocylindrales bacterium]
MAAARTLVVLGLARSGIAAARVAARGGWTVLVADDKPDAAADLPDGAQPIDVDAAADRIREADLVIPSPGVPASHRLLVAARAGGVRIAPEIEFAADRLTGTLVAVTGTNGKSTTVSLVGAILEAAGRRTFTGGNLGDPLCNAVGREPYDFIVAEVSSFQLEHATTFHPHVAAMLNLTPDHLDRHGSMDEYLAAKLRLFQCMTAGDHAVLPRSSDWTAKAVASTRASVSYFDTPPPGQREIGAGGYRIRLPQRGWPQLPHDLENAAAAVEIARVLGVDRVAVERAIAGFRPLRHRLAKVAEIGGVAWWNDSKATNVGAAASSLRAFDGRVILLAGGISKGCDFAALANEAPRITLVVAYGEAGPEIEATLAASMRVVRESALHAAVLRAAKEARPGDVVLLAPACSSFDEFRDYADRGQSFERWVHELESVGKG